MQTKRLSECGRTASLHHRNQAPPYYYRVVPPQYPSVGVVCHPCRNLQDGRLLGRKAITFAHGASLLELPAEAPSSSLPALLPGPLVFLRRGELA
jgi:hypothetical protein